MFERAWGRIRVNGILGLSSWGWEHDEPKRGRIQISFMLSTMTNLKVLRLSSPGSGKTTRILSEAKETLEQGGRVFLTAFGRKNVRDFRTKIGWLPEAQRDRLWITTIHAEAFHFIGARPETNLTKFLFENDQEFGLRFSDKAKKLAGVCMDADPSLMDGESNDDICYAEVQRLRAMGLSWRDTAFMSPLSDRVKWIWDILQDGFTRGYWDFLRLLEAAAERGMAFRADYVAVDEINDLTPLQCRIVGRSEGGKVVFCGDLNQTIHEWAGVDPAVILDLPHDVVEYQNVSYRLTKEVAEYADRIISRLKDLPGEKIIPLAGTGEIIWDYNFRNVLQRATAWGNVLVLGRTNYIVDRARHEALEAGANVVLNDDEVLKSQLSAMIKDMPPTLPVAKLEALLGPWLPSGRFWKNGAKKKLREAENRWIPWSTIYSEYGTPDLKRVMEGKLDWYDGRPGFDPGKTTISFSTIHAAKGSEEETVVVLRDLSTRIREGLWHSEESEVRVNYVAATRARRRLCVSALGGERMTPYLF